MLINRNEAKTVSEAEETRIRDEIEEFTHPTSSGNSKLHIPEEESTAPLCPYTQKQAWRRAAVDAWPVGHRELCGHCVEEYFENENR